MVRRLHFWVVKPWFSHLSLAIANLKHIFQSAQILAIYIENLVNMCSGMPVFAGRRRGDRLSNPPMLTDAVGGAIALLAIPTNDDVDEVELRRLRWWLKKERKKDAKNIAPVEFRVVSDHPKSSSQ